MAFRWATVQQVAYIIDEIHSLAICLLRAPHAPNLPTVLIGASSGQNVICCPQDNALRPDLQSANRKRARRLPRWPLAFSYRRQSYMGRPEFRRFAMASAPLR